jgi:hypothetical protein
VHRSRRRVERDPRPYTDPAPAPVDEELLPARHKEKVPASAAA